MAVHVSYRSAARLDRNEAWLGSSQMAESLREFDWSRTPLGPIGGWSQSLRSAVAICLRSPFQMAIYWGPGLNCIYNDAERDVLGKLHPRALGLPARDLLHDSWDVIGPQLHEVIVHGDATLAEDQPLTLDRRGRPEVSYFTYSYSPILDDDGTVGGVLLVTQDTTARVLAKRRSDAKRELIFRSMDAPTAADACAVAAGVLAAGEDVPFALIYLLDEAGERASCMAAAGASGWLRTMRPDVELDVSADDTSALFAHVAGLRGGGTVAPAHWFAIGPGRRHACERAFVAVIARDGADAPEGFLVAGLRDDLAFDGPYEEFLEVAAMMVGRSVAAARARETQRRRVTDIAAIDRAKSALFSEASHELRTPLALILGHLSELLDERTRLPQPTRERLRVAHRSALRMLKLVDGLLDFSRIEAGASIGALRPTDVARLTAEVAAMFRSAADRAGLELIVDCCAQPEPMWIDRDAWERIVSHLISNALKFTPRGEIRVRTRTHRGHMCLVVEDTGIGIAPEELDQIFSRFYRSPDPRARTHEGSGIGLALVRQLAAVQGGSVEAQSRPNQGTRMIVRVPLARERPPGADCDAAASQSIAGDAASLLVTEAEGWFGEPESPATSPGDRPVPDPVTPQRADDAGSARPCALVAEDNADMREYLRRLLSPHFSVILAADGDHAWELARREPPSIIVSDVMMPGLDGFSLIRDLRADPRTRDVPVILLSALADPESTLEALELGADDYIIKPFGAPELLARVRATLRNAQARADAAAARGRFEEEHRHEGQLHALLNDLRAAQRRVAAAGDAERRRVERDLHDGAQQRLTAIRLELGLVRELMDDDSATARVRLDELRRELDDAVEELRELAHGIYPPLLASDGLHAALVSAARHAAIPVTVEAGEIRRAPRAIESAAYFCCLEALQNAAKHAGAGARASIHLSTAGGLLDFEVSDDGLGFAPNAVRPGHGLINLRDRVDALGGHVEVTSAPGRGTTVVGRIPLP